MKRARKYAKRRVSTWFDRDFRTLTLEQQGLYDALCAYPELSRCGVIPFIPNRLTVCSDSLTARKLTKLVMELEESLYVVVDIDMAELLVRSHIRHDEGLRTPNIARSIARSFGSIVSKKVRNATGYELARLYAESPDLPGWDAFKAQDPELFEWISEWSKEGVA